jgi:hypothetical protein
VQDIGIGAARVTAVRRSEGSPSVYLEFRGLRDAPYTVDKDTRVRIALSAERAAEMRRQLSEFLPSHRRAQEHEQRARAHRGARGRRRREWRAGRTEYSGLFRSADIGQVRVGNALAKVAQALQRRRDDLIGQRIDGSVEGGADYVVIELVDELVKFLLRCQSVLPEPFSCSSW